MAAEPLRYFDRYDRTLKDEQIYGEGWLRWGYGNPVGRFAIWLVLRRAIFSQYYARRMNQRYSDLQILPFIAKYGIDVTEFAKSPFDFKTFNQFFYRALKPEARPIAGDERVAVLPADGRHLAFPDIDAAEGFYVKGAKFSLAELFGEGEGERKRAAAKNGSSGAGNPGPGDVGNPSSGGAATESDSLARVFAGGSMLISRLCPTDYHRFHFPVSGVAGEPRLINGWLYSVNPIALRRNLRYLVQNKRVVTRIDSPEFGPVAIVEVGATNVGSIQQSFVPGRTVRKGEEKGFFAFGGSCVITLFARGRILLDPDVVEPSARQVEVYARMGDRLGVAAR